MSISTTTSLEDKTFTTFTHEQGMHYAQHRTKYHSSVYEHILKYHKSTGGQTISLLDVGCGPGTATFILAPHFTETTGLDSGPSMIATAEFLNPSPARIAFHISPAENMSVIPTSSIDLLTVANAAHWFDMPRFWSEAARVLKPGGSVALWVTAQAVPHPDLPNAENIEAAISRHREKYLKPYLVDGNLLNRDGYQNLTMPWHVKPTPVQGFDQASCNRRVWGPDELFTASHETYRLDEFETMMATKSPVVRWRAANPDKVETDQDVARVLRKEIEGLLLEKGVSSEEMIYKRAMPGVVLMIKRK